MLNGIQGGIAFFEHTPEIVLAALRHPRMATLASGTNKTANAVFKNSRFVKYQMYRDIWPDLDNRPKFTGNEAVEGLFGNITASFLGGTKPLFSDVFELSVAELEAQLNL
jgi:hypothetical protein